MAATTHVVVLALVALSPLVEGKVGGPAAASRNQSARVGAEALQNAMDSVMGCGSSIEVEREWGSVLQTKEALQTMWLTLPKDVNGRVEWPWLRHLAHRHFMQRYGLLVRGFEPARVVNASHEGHAEVLSKHVPHFVELLLDENRGGAQGFSLDDAVSLVMTLERLIFDSESALLERAFWHEKVEPRGPLTRGDLLRVLETYMLLWTVQDDGIVEFAVENPTALDEGFPNWRDVISFVRGQIHALEFSRSHAQQPHREQLSSMSGMYTFEDAHEVVGGVTKSFASYWESVCQEMKGTLVTMDKSGTGRVPLSQFYSSALSTEARFGESEAYLRDLGALDETSVYGKQVLIANYMQAASNCIVSGPNYLVCCANECESILGDIETAIGAPSATPDEILRVVQDISSPSSEDDDPPMLEGPLKGQLERLARLHDGKVPLHSRLFAQWLHYAYPRECAFPHKAGTHSAQTPTEFVKSGQNHLATDSEMRLHAATSGAAAEEEKEEEADEASWTAQHFSDETEVISVGRAATQLRAPWEEGQRSSSTLGALGGAFAALLLAAWLLATQSGKQRGHSSLPSSCFDTFGKSHLV